MPHAVTENFSKEKNKQVNKPVNLFTLYDYDGLSHDLRFAQSKSNVTFGGLLYQAFPILADELPENTQGEVDAIKIRVANVSRVFQYYIENYDLREKKITIRQAWLDRLDDPYNFIYYSYYIDTYSSNDRAVELTCSSKFDVSDVEIPFSRYMRCICRWTVVGGYKGTECGATSSETTCDGTMEACRARNNISRYGAFPSIPARRTYVT